MRIKGVEVEFDVTSPLDVERYRAACEKMERGAAALDAPAACGGTLERYAAVLDTQLRLFGSFLDEAFGGGTAHQLLGGNPSLRKVAAVERAVRAALLEQGEAVREALAAYAPDEG